MLTSKKKPEMRSFLLRVPTYRVKLCKQPVIDTISFRQQALIVKLKPLGFQLFSTAPTIAIATTIMINWFGPINTIHIYYIIILVFIFKHMYNNTL